MITNLTWILTTITEFYCASLIHLWDSPSLQTANWSHLPESKFANLYWPPSFCPYVLVDEVLLFLLGVNSSIWTLDSFSFPYKGLCSFSYPFFCFISFTCSFGLFSPACKHVLGSSILKDMPSQTSSPAPSPSYHPHFSVLLWMQTSQSKIV